MDKIVSFQVDHECLGPGLYLARIDGDIATYDLRCTRPNTPPFMEPAAIHTMGHLFATYVRNSKLRRHIVHFGPMGCRTGFYFLTRDLAHTDAIALVQEALAFIADYTGEVPGANPVECGNYREHDLEGARHHAQTMSQILRQWQESDLQYPEE